MSDSKSPYKSRGIHRPAGVAMKSRLIAPWWCFGQTVAKVSQEMEDFARRDAVAKLSRSDARLSDTRKGARAVRTT